MDRQINESNKIIAIDKIDPIIHLPTRLKIMTYLYVVDKMDFVYLKNITDLSWGNLSKNVTKLEEAGYIRTEKKFEDKKPKTRLWLSDQGRQAFEKYKDNLKKFLS